MKMIKTVLLLVASACVWPVMAGMSIEEWCQTLRDQTDAIRRGDWQQAAVYSAKASVGNDVTGFIPINEGLGDCPHTALFGNKTPSLYQD